MASEALELALALYRAPIQRHALRGMELPRDIGVVIQLASAPQPLLHDAAVELNESEDTVLEASRFYLQQALFQPDASAYQVLGLPPNAAPGRIREHYRWLQRWLHPDRRGEDWEALLATRVNQAWGHLRNEAVRRAYDKKREHADLTGSDSARSVEPRPQGKWQLIGEAQERGSLAKKIAMGVSLCSCLTLLYVAITRDDRVLQEDLGTRSATELVVLSSKAMTPRTVASVEAPVPAIHAAPAPIAGSDPESPATRDVPTQSMESPSPVASPIEKRVSAPERAPAVPEASTAAAMAQNAHPVGDNDLPQLRAQVEDARPPSAPVAQGLVSNDREFASAPAIQPARPPAQQQDRATGVPHNAEPADSGIHPIALKPKLLVAVEASPESTGRNVLAQESVREVPGATVPAIKRHDRTAAATARVASIHSNSDHMPSATRTESFAGISKVAAAGPAQVTDEKGRSESAVLPRVQTAPPNETTVATVVHNEQGSARSPATADSDRSVSSANTLARIGLARERAQELSMFFGDSGKRSPPVWNDVRGQASAERLRSALHARARLRNVADFAIDAPHWRVSENLAALSADYHLRQGGTVSESGRFSLNMVWREKMWLVTDVELEPAP
jgi:hypothetical protein